MSRHAFDWKCKSVIPLEFWPRKWMCVTNTFVSFLVPIQRKKKELQRKIMNLQLIPWSWWFSQNLWFLPRCHWAGDKYVPPGLGASSDRADPLLPFSLRLHPCPRPCPPLPHGSPIAPLPQSSTYSASIALCWSPPPTTDPSDFRIQINFSQRQ